MRPSELWLECGVLAFSRLDFPVELAEWCIRLQGVKRVSTMLDPFLGIGNSAVAAKRCRVKKFIGFEIDETYLAEATCRIGL